MSNLVTRDFYERVCRIGAHFGRCLYADELPPALFTVKRGLRSFGYCVPARWEHQERNSVAEIVLNPVLFGDRSWIDLFKTIVEQQCHLWQHEHGHPSRPGYHNAEWSRKLKSLGLIPTANGKVGGCETGQRVETYPEPNGRFLTACVGAVTRKDLFPVVLSERSIEVPALAAFPVRLGLPRRMERMLFAPVGAWARAHRSEEAELLAASKRKVTYVCNACNIRVWGGPDLKLRCQSCDRQLRVQPRVRHESL